MKWEKCSLIAAVSVGTDELGNEIKQDETVKITYGRFTPWNTTDLNMEGRTVSKNSRKVLVRCAFSDFPDCEKIEMDGMVYQITEATDLNRFTLLYAVNTKG